MSTLYQQQLNIVIYMSLEKVKQHPHFTVGASIEHLTETLSRGAAVDSICYKGAGLRVWHRRGKLMITPDHTIDELLALA